MARLLQPYLIQRCNLKSAGDGRVAGGTLSDAVRFDYMGSSEFEFGTLPRSLRDLQSRAARDDSALACLVLPGINDRHGAPMLAVGLLPGQEEDYASGLLAVISRKARTKESPRFEDQITPISELDSWHSLRGEPPAGQRRGDKRAAWFERVQSQLTTIWWDLDNSVFTTFDPGIAQDLPALLRGSWAYMDKKPNEREAEEAAPGPRR